MRNAKKTVVFKKDSGTAGMYVIAKMTNLTHIRINRSIKDKCVGDKVTREDIDNFMINNDVEVSVVA